jgi:hypothetical protein
VSLIATRFLKFIYALSVILYSLVGVFLLIALLAASGRAGGGAAILVALIFVPLWYLLGLIWLRVVVEFFIVFFRIGDDVRAMRIGAVGLPRAVLVAQPTSPAPAPQVRAAVAPQPLVPPPTGTGEGWLRDPSGRHPDRWWDGTQWTQWVRDMPGGTRSEDPPFR